MTEPPSSRRAGATARVRRALRRVRESQNLADPLELGLIEVCTTLGFRRATLSRIDQDRIVLERVFLPNNPRGAARMLERLADLDLELTDLPDEAAATRARTAVLVSTPEACRLPREITDVTGECGYVAAPILRDDEVIAFIHADDLHATDPLGERDRECLWAFTEGLSYAIERAASRDRERLHRAVLRDVIATAERATRVRETPRREEPPAAPSGRPLILRTDVAAFGLTDRETEVLRLMAGGSTNRDIAERLVISEGTVKTHAARILRKLDAHTRAEAVSKFFGDRAAV